MKWLGGHLVSSQGQCTTVLFTLENLESVMYVSVLVTSGLCQPQRKKRDCSLCLCVMQVLYVAAFNSRALAMTVYVSGHISVQHVYVSLGLPVHVCVLVCMSTCLCVFVSAVGAQLCYWLNLQMREQTVTPLHIEDLVTDITSTLRMPGSVLCCI